MKKLLTGIMALAPLSAFAQEANVPTLPSTVDLSSFYTYAGLIIAALVGMIVYRKAVKITNRYS